MAEFVPTWVPGGGIVLAVCLERHDWQLPPEATLIPSAHLTLIGRSAFLERQKSMVSAWESVRHTLPVPPKVELASTVHLHTDFERKTWFLPVVNQDDFRSYVRSLTEILDDAFRRQGEGCFANPETNRYFHVSVANNSGGDPFASIGAIRPPQEAH